MKKRQFYRSLSLRMKGGAPETYNESDRSVEVVAATENPVSIYDWDRGTIDEVLLMSGLIMPESRQVVLLDSHSRWGTSSVVGSYRDMKVAEGPAYQKFQGHNTYFSLTA